MTKAILILLMSAAPLGHASSDATVRDQKLAKVLPRLEEACVVLRQSAENHLQNSEPGIAECQGAGLIPASEQEKFASDFDRDCVEGLKSQALPQLDKSETVNLEMDVDQSEVWSRYANLFQVLYKRFCEGDTASL